MEYWNGSENIPVRAVLRGSVNEPNVGIPVTYKGVEIGSVIDILLSVEEVEVETCLSWLGELALPRRHRNDSGFPIAGRRTSFQAVHPTELAGI